MSKLTLFIWFGSIGAVSASLLCFVPLITTELVTWVALAAIFFVGMPHGALDIITLKRIAGITSQGCLEMGAKSLARLLLLATLYALIVIISFSAWLWSPTLCLILLLLVGVVHFRHDWGQSSLSLCLSAVVLTSPSIFHTKQLIEIFEWLFVPQGNAVAIVFAMKAFCLIAMLAVMAFLPKEKRWGQIVTSLSIVWLCTWLLSPLLYFTLYFCTVHAIAHTFRLKSRAKLTWRELAYTSFLPMLATGAMGYVAYIYLDINAVKHTLYPLIFIGLFAVTVPHVFLDSLFKHGILQPKVS